MLETTKKLLKKNHRKQVGGTRCKEGVMTGVKRI